MKLSHYLLFPEGKASIHNTWKVSVTTAYCSTMAETPKPGRNTVVSQYQRNLTTDINTTMAVYPGYMGKNVKKDQDLVLDDLHQYLLT